MGPKEGGELLQQGEGGLCGTTGTAVEMAVVKGGDSDDDDEGVELRDKDEKRSRKSPTPQHRQTFLPLVPISHPLYAKAPAACDAAALESAATDCSYRDIVKPILDHALLEREVTPGGDLSIYLSSLYESQIGVPNTVIEEECETR